MPRSSSIPRAYQGNASQYMRGGIRREQPSAAVAQSAQIAKQTAGIERQNLRQLEDVSNRFARASLEIAAVKQATDMNSAQAEMYETLVGFENGLKERTDYQNWVGEHDEVVNGLKKRFSEQYGAGVLNALERDFRQFSLRSNIRVQDQARGLMHGSMIAKSRDNLDLYESHLEDLNPEKRHLAHNMMKGEIAQLLSARAITPEAAQKALEGYERQFHRQGVRHAAMEKMAAGEDWKTWLLETKGLPVDEADRRALVGVLDFHADLAKVKQKEAQEAAENESWKEINQLAWDRKLTPNHLKNSNIDPSRHQGIYRSYVNDVKREAKGGPNVKANIKKEQDALNDKIYYAIRGGDVTTLTQYNALAGTKLRTSQDKALRKVLEEETGEAKYKESPALKNVLSFIKSDLEAGRYVKNPDDVEKLAEETPEGQRTRNESRSAWFTDDTYFREIAKDPKRDVQAEYFKKRDARIEELAKEKAKGFLQTFGRMFPGSLFPNAPEAEAGLQTPAPTLRQPGESAGEYLKRIGLD